MQTCLWLFTFVALVSSAPQLKATGKSNPEYGLKSRENCQKYSKWLEPPILLSDQSSIPGACGITIDPKISEGANVSELEFPHVARLGYEKDSEIKWICDVSLISDRFLLTAAHCLKGDDGPHLAKLGANSPIGQTIVKIAEKIAHPKFKSPQKYHDIALLQLEKPLRRFTDSIRPACLQTERNAPVTEAIAVGWGLTKWLDTDSDRFLKVSLPIVNHGKCSQTIGRSRRLELGVDDNSMICAGGYDLNKDTCLGGSGGGPLQFTKAEDCTYYIIGLTSFGSVCGASPRVYTRISNYIPWIESKVWPEKE